MKFKTTFLTSWTLIHLSLGGKTPIRRNGWWVFPGRSCGVLNPIKYLDTMPEDTSQLSCTLVKADENHFFKGAEEICQGSGHGWKLVRWVPPGNTWHPATDQLSGTEEYGNPGDKTSPFSVSFNQMDFNQFLFATGDCEKWLIATKESVVGSDFQAFYSNANRDILKSSLSPEPHQAKWYRRQVQQIDPWISLTDHGPARSADDILYGGKSANTHSGNSYNGVGVYIRKGV